MLAPSSTPNHTRSMPSLAATGASSGIGQALALGYADNGVHLALAGRSQERLDQVAAACRAKGATVTTDVIDIRDRQRLRDWIISVDDDAPIDLAIANAGVTSGIGMGRLFEHPDIARNSRSARAAWLPTST